MADTKITYGYNFASPLKQSLKTEKKLKELEIVSKYISVFVHVAKFADFWLKKTDISKTQGVYHVIHVFFRSSLGKVPSFIMARYV